MNKSAKEMFEELGYKLETETKEKLRYTAYENDNIFAIEILKIDKIIWFGNADIHYDVRFSFEEFKALQKQIEELGWNE